MIRPSWQSGGERRGNFACEGGNRARQPVATGGGHGPGGLMGPWARQAHGPWALP